MDLGLESDIPSTSLAKCCECGATIPLMNRSYSGTWLRSVKRKYDEFDVDHRFFIPGFSLPQIARVEVENERDALREMVSRQQLSIQDLSLELDEERNASSSAANEAMSMILRLQREKAEVQMEARQFKRFAEEKMAHDQQELSAMEDLLYKREQIIESLYCEVHAYKHRMLSYGIPESEIDGEIESMTRNNSFAGNHDVQFELPPYDYPPLKCSLNEAQVPEFNNDQVDVEKYAFGETPHSLDHLKDLENRINQLERSPRSFQSDVEYPGKRNVFEKFIIGQSPKKPHHLRRSSNNSSNSLFAMGKDIGPDAAAESPRNISGFQKMEYLQAEDNFKKAENASDTGDDMSDRVYTIDSVHQGISYNGLQEKPSGGLYGDDAVTTKEPSFQVDFGGSEIKHLYLRLQALEADRESMRQALISTKTDEAQIVLLKEIAQQLCKDMSSGKRMPVQKSSVAVSFSFVSVVKWVASFVFWRKKTHRCKYMFGLSGNYVGLRILLDNVPRRGRWRCILSTEV